MDIYCPLGAGLCDEMHEMGLELSRNVSSYIPGDATDRFMGIAILLPHCCT